MPTGRAYGSLSYCGSKDGRVQSGEYYVCNSMTTSF